MTAKLQSMSTDTLARQLVETRNAWILYVRGAMRPRPTTIEGLEKKMAHLRDELTERGYFSQD